MRLLLILPAIGFGILAGSPAAAQSCGPPCKKCAAELGVPLDARGIPMHGASGRAWEACVAKNRTSASNPQGQATGQSPQRR